MLFLKINNFLRKKMNPKKIRKYLFNSEKILRKEQSKEYFPILKNSYNNFLNQNNTINHITIKHQSKAKINRSSSSFYKKHYINKNILKVDNINYKTIFQNISKKELDSILYKLKHYYNNILLITNKNNNKIEELNNIIKIKEKKLEQYLDFKDFELPDEKISVKDFNELNNTREEIEKKIKELMNKKQKLNYLLLNENQYLKSLEYMYENEKNKSLEIKKEINDVEFNLHNTEKNLKILKNNLNGYANKNMGFNILNQKLQNNIDLTFEVIEHQQNKNMKLDKTIINKEEKMNNLKNQLKYLKGQNKISFEEYKEQKYNQIKMAHEKEKDKIEKEKYYIEVINSLYLIQKYFIDTQNFDKKSLESDKDYINLKTCGNYLISKIDDNDNDNNNNNDKKDINEEINIINNNLDCIDNNNNSSSSLSNKDKNKNENKNKLNINDNLDLQDLKQKFNSINITKDQLFDYYSELSSKITFYLKRLNNFHEKEINLENKKELLNKKVRKLIENDFYFFEELTKSNTRLQKYISNNESFINELIEKNKNTNYEEINKQINNYENNTKNIKKKLSNLNKEQIIINSKALYTLTDNLILTNKNFFSIIIDMLKELISFINQFNNNNNTNKDSLRNTCIRKMYTKPKTQRILKSDKIDNFSKYRKDSINNKSLSLLKDINNTINNEIINDFISLHNNLVNFEETCKKYLKYKDNNCNLVLYIKKLIDCCVDNKKFEKDLSSENIYEHLLNNCFLDKNKKIINKSFSDLLIDYNIPNKYNTFNYLKCMTIQIIDNIKLIIDFLNKNENNQILLKEFMKNNYSTNNLNEKNFSNKKKKTLKDDNNLKMKEIIKNFNNNNNTSENNSIKSGEYERDDSSIDTEMTRKEKKVKIKKVSSVGKKIANRLYRPFLEKTYFIRKLNKNMNDIKEETLKSSRTIFALEKKKNEEKIMSDQMMIYNNPNLIINNLSQPIYNDLNSLIINNKKIKEIRKKEKRFQSSSIIKKKLFKIYK